MEIVFIFMIMFSFGLFGIGEIINSKQKTKKCSIIDWDKPKEIWENDIEDFRYYESR